MRVLCGQCGHVNKFDDDQAVGPTIACANCGHEMPVGGLNGEADAPPAPAGVDAEEPGFAEQARLAEGRKVSVTCPNCGRTVLVGARAAGHRARCKSCNHLIEVPYPDDLEEFAIPSRRHAGRGIESGLDLVEPEPPQEEAETTDVEEPEPVEALEASAVIDTAPPLVPTSSRPELLAETVEPEPAPAATPEPGPGPSPDHTELASAMAGFDEDRAARPRPKRPGQGPFKWAVLALVACAILAVPAVVVVPMLLESGSTQPEGDGTVGRIGPAPVLVDPDPDEDPDDAPGPQAGPDPRPKPRPRPRPKPKPIKPRCDIRMVAAETVAGGGYFPAGVGEVYWRVRVRITGGRRPVKLEAHGSDVRLVAGSDRYPSLGLAAEDQADRLLPRIANEAVVEVAPRQSRDLTFVFRAPRELDGASLFVRDVALKELTLPKRTQPPPAAALAGTYVEQQPRSLKPLLRHPVMAALQAAPSHEITLAPGEGGDLAVSVPAAEVTGTARSISPGVYHAALDYGGEELGATMRFVEGGRRMVLYLADRPFHQLVYVNPKRPAPPPERVVAAERRRPTPSSAPATRPTATQPLPQVGPNGPGMERVNEFEENVFFDPNRPRRKEEDDEDLRLPTGPSIFD